MDENANLNTLYILKEPLQTLWESETVELMQDRLEAWCRIADQSTMLYLKKFAKRARGLRDTEYFKLKIRQSSLPDEDSMFYVTA